MKRGQVSFEYMILMGFVIMVLGAILSIALYYTASAQDRMRVNQINSFANKIVSSCESVFASGYPSKATIRVYLPDGVKNIVFFEDSMYINFVTSTGNNTEGFPIQVPVSGSITSTPGVKKLEITATGSAALVTQK